MKPYQANLGTEFYISLLRFLLSAKQHIIAIGAEHGLSSIQAITLLLLDESAGCPMKQLGFVFHCDASNVTGIVDGLESKGLVARENDPNDRRIKTVRICPAGKRLRERILTQLSQDNGFLFDPLSDNEAKQFVNIVGKLAPNQKPTV